MLAALIVSLVALGASVVTNIVVIDSAIETKADNAEVNKNVESKVLDIRERITTVEGQYNGLVNDNNQLSYQLKNAEYTAQAIQSNLQSINNRVNNLVKEVELQAVELDNLYNKETTDKETK